jgi:hypothetical protein
VFQHVDEAAYLAVVSVLPRIDDDVDVQVRKLRLQPPGDFDCRIARTAHAEDDLELRVILLAEGT